MAHRRRESLNRVTIPLAHTITATHGCAYTNPYAGAHRRRVARVLLGRAERRRQEGVEPARDHRGEAQRHGAGHLRSGRRDDEHAGVDEARDARLRRPRRQSRWPSHGLQLGLGQGWGQGQGSGQGQGQRQGQSQGQG